MLHTFTKPHRTHDTRHCAVDMKQLTFLDQLKALDFLLSPVQFDGLEYLANCFLLDPLRFVCYQEMVALDLPESVRNQMIVGLEHSMSLMQFDVETISLGGARWCCTVSEYGKALCDSEGFDTQLEACMWAWVQVKYYVSGNDAGQILVNVAKTVA